MKIRDIITMGNVKLFVVDDEVYSIVFKYKKADSYNIQYNEVTKQKFFQQLHIKGLISEEDLFLTLL